MNNWRGLCVWTLVIRTGSVLEVSFQSLSCVHMAVGCVFYHLRLHCVPCSVLCPLSPNPSQKTPGHHHSKEVAGGARIWVPAARGTYLRSAKSGGQPEVIFPWHLGLLVLLAHLEPSVKGERQGEPTGWATPLPFRFPDAASRLNVAFSCAAGNKAA